MTKNENSFTWDKFYKSLAVKIIDKYNSDKLWTEKELREIMTNWIKKGLLYIDMDSKISEYWNKNIENRIDPFTFFANFNRGINSENRKAILEDINKKLKLGLKDINWDYLVPVVNNQNAWFFTGALDKEDKDIDNLWELFWQWLEWKVDNKLFDTIKEQSFIWVAKLTMWLFWINPDKYISLDSNTKILLEKKYEVIFDNIFNFERYNKIISNKKIRKDWFIKIVEEAYWIKALPEINKKKTEVKKEEKTFTKDELIKIADDINNQLRWIWIDIMERNKQTATLLFWLFLSETNKIDTKFKYSLNKEYTVDSINKIFSEIYNSNTDKKIIDIFKTTLINKNFENFIDKFLKDLDRRILKRKDEYIDGDLFWDIYEYFLWTIASSGNLGEYYTPRHIVKLMVKLLENKKLDLSKHSIYDPTCWTGWFLSYIWQEFKDKWWNENNIFWTEINSDTQRYAVMNMFFHGDWESNISQQNSLDLNYILENKESFNFVIANPPYWAKNVNESNIIWEVFRTEEQDKKVKEKIIDILIKQEKNKDKKTQLEKDFKKLSLEKLRERLKEIDKDNKKWLSILNDVVWKYSTTSSELLFLQQIYSVLKPDWYAAVIIPEWVNFQWWVAKNIREFLLANCSEFEVFSLPAWAFMPYTWVKTSFYVFKKWGKSNVIKFYDIKNDWFSLDKKRKAISWSDIEKIEDFIKNSDIEKIKSSWIYKEIFVNEEDKSKFLEEIDKLKKDEKIENKYESYNKKIFKKYNINLNQDEFNDFDSNWFYSLESKWFSFSIKDENEIRPFEYPLKKLIDFAIVEKPWINPDKKDLKVWEWDFNYLVSTDLNNKSNFNESWEIINTELKVDKNLLVEKYRWKIIKKWTIAILWVWSLWPAVIVWKETFINTNIFTIEIKNENLDPEFLVYLLNLSNLNKLSVWWERKYFTIDRLWDFQIPLPPLYKQKEIVRKLKKLDKLWKLSWDLIEKLDEIWVEDDFFEKEKKYIDSTNNLSLLNWYSWKVQEDKDKKILYKKEDNWFPIIKIWTLKNWIIDDAINIFEKENFEKKFWKYFINKWDLLFAWSWTPETSWWPFISKNTWYLNQHIWKLILDKKNINKKFLYYYLFKINKSLITKAKWSAWLQHVSDKDFFTEVGLIQALFTQKQIAKYFHTYFLLKKFIEIFSNWEDIIDSLKEKIFFSFLYKEDNENIDSILNNIEDIFEEEKYFEEEILEKTFAKIVSLIDLEKFSLDNIEIIKKALEIELSQEEIEKLDIEKIILSIWSTWDISKQNVFSALKENLEFILLKRDEEKWEVYNYELYKKIKNLNKDFLLNKQLYKKFTYEDLFEESFKNFTKHIKTVFEEISLELQKLTNPLNFKFKESKVFNYLQKYDSIVLTYIADEHKNDLVFDYHKLSSSFGKKNYIIENNLGKICENINKNYYFDEKDILNYYLSLLTKQFVILYWLTGIWKSKIAKEFPKNIYWKDTYSSYFKHIAIKAWWDDDKDIKWYYDNLEQDYREWEMLNIIKRAIIDKNNPYFVLLDEMNISKVEHYFSDFLSYVETIENQWSFIQNNELNIYNNEALDYLEEIKSHLENIAIDNIFNYKPLLEIPEFKSLLTLKSNLWLTLAHDLLWNNSIFWVHSLLWHQDDRELLKSFSKYIKLKLWENLWEIDNWTVKDYLNFIYNFWAWFFPNSESDSIKLILKDFNLIFREDNINYLKDFIYENYFDSNNKLLNFQDIKDDDLKKTHYIIKKVIEQFLEKTNLEVKLQKEFHEGIEYYFDNPSKITSLYDLNLLLLDNINNDKFDLYFSDNSSTKIIRSLFLLWYNIFEWKENQDKQDFEKSYLLEWRQFSYQDIEDIDILNYKITRKHNNYFSDFIYLSDYNFKYLEKSKFSKIDQLQKFRKDLIDKINEWYSLKLSSLTWWNRFKNILSLTLVELENAKFELWVRIPDNLYITWTINIDETTEWLSPKVIDRANIIEYNEVALNKDKIWKLSFLEEPKKIWIDLNEKPYEKPFDVSKDIKVHNLLEIWKEIDKSDNWDSIKDYKIKLEKEFEDYIELINEIYFITKDANQHFWYRTIEEILKYMWNCKTRISDNEEILTEFFDLQILQKILPKIWWYNQKTEIVLINILKKLVDTNNTLVLNSKISFQEKLWESWNNVQNFDELKNNISFISDKDSKNEIIKILDNHSFSIANKYWNMWWQFTLDYWNKINDIIQIIFNELEKLSKTNKKIEKLINEKYDIQSVAPNDFYDLTSISEKLEKLTEDKDNLINNTTYKKSVEKIITMLENYYQEGKTSYFI